MWKPCTPLRRIELSLERPTTEGNKNEPRTHFVSPNHLFADPISATILGSSAVRGAVLAIPKKLTRFVRPPSRELQNAHFKTLVNGSTKYQR